MLHSTRIMWSSQGSSKCYTTRTIKRTLPNGMVYDNFKTWCKLNNVQKSSENVLLAHFSEKSKVYKSSTLWSHFSMLKSTLSAKDNVNIGKYSRLISFWSVKMMGLEVKNQKLWPGRNFVNSLLMLMIPNIEWWR